MLSEYFDDLIKSYCAELEDLETDSEGKNVLTSRLNEKRAQLGALLPMIDSAPEMVAPVFHGACSFHDSQTMTLISSTEPDDFPAWETLVPVVEFASWANDYVALVLAEPAGERFLISTACLEFLYERKAERTRRSGSPSDENDQDSDRFEVDGDQDDTDAQDRDMDEAGADWLADQGFDRRG